MKHLSKVMTASRLPNQKQTLHDQIVADNVRTASDGFLMHNTSGSVIRDETADVQISSRSIRHGNDKVERVSGDVSRLSDVLNASNDCSNWAKSTVCGSSLLSA